ncbi:MAG: molybdopterin molybdotransferase MoeA [Porticoccaceae bacterium]|nr:molybdopterin molybdotransferase MoeA [Porticoccaceae bacterium]
MTINTPMMSLADARQTMLASLAAGGDARTLATETKPLAELPGRILAEDIVSPLDSPPADNSAMDGYALRFADISGSSTYPVVGKSLAGKPFNGTVSTGECVRITTGATLPGGTDTVVIQENVAVEAGNMMRLVTPPSRQGASVRYRGEDVARGDIMLSAGRRIGAIETGVLATLGLAQALVRKPLRVALFVSGDELRAPGEALGPGDIYESNRHVLQVMLRKLGIEVVDLGVVADDPQQLRQVCMEGQRRADVVLTCGGASVGEADYAREVLQELGNLDFWKVAIKPGKPFIFGHLVQTPFFGLPGNPVSALVTFHQLVAPVLRKLQGADDPEPLMLSAPITQPMRSNRNRLELVRGRLSRSKLAASELHASPGCGFVVTPDRQQSSGAFGALARCNCFILVEAGAGELPAGTLLPVLPFDELLGAGVV